ncbi:HNH endonuclease [Flavobacterium undicola]|uniref:HNH endonuclease n=1 Tax=Flavobacterium undicola TaxID=1932779 RepID=UPI0013784723|nr:HNH endonuclease [Flavobacterium undicola]MBA0885183.1 hypothetical protein [Flavobacterium undicola]
MKHCIWCSRKEPHVTFEKEAHTFPRSVGGKNICENVCDDCNHNFGSTKPNLPAVEIVLKEILNFSRYFLLYTKEVPRNQRFKSQYFSVNWDTKVLKLKPSYKLQKGFQEKLGRQFTRGMYKIYLEERERIKKDSHNSKFDFIREFARYDLGELQIFYLKPKYPFLGIFDGTLENPSIHFGKESEKEEKEFGIYSYQFMGHIFCIPVSKLFKELHFERYKKYLKENDNSFGTELIPIKYFSDVDFTFKFIFQ